MSHSRNDSWYTQSRNVPFIIGIYYGVGKPTGGPNKFLRALVNDVVIFFKMDLSTAIDYLE
jgi:hypothetical protein